MNRVLVIGATGTVGSQVVSQLLAKRGSVRALVRNPSTACLPPQVELVRGDLTIPETLDPCFEGMDDVFLVWTAPPPAVTPAIERIAKHARRIVYLSAPIKTPHPLFQQPNPARTLNEQIERLLEASGLEWTFLRPGMFAANALSWWAPQIRNGNVVRWPYLSTPTAPIDERDIARVAVLALCGDGHAGKDYVLTGPQSLTQFEQISIIGQVLGRGLRIEEISPDQAPREQLSGIPPGAMKMLLGAWAAASGQPAFVTSTVAELTGTPAQSFSGWVAAHSSAFLPYLR